MLIASYLLGYNDNGTVSHLGVDHVFPRRIDGACFELCESSHENPQLHHDLLIYFPYGEQPKELICLPDLPEGAVAALLCDVALPVVDFSCGRNIRVHLGTIHKRDCA
ncbi:hypothetical protein [Spongiibacter sp.]|uniref:hypothetical protein n=1 Tax=Spongiibacter sp. TaxID=2024860 RepID=UPI00356A8FE9